MKLVVIKKYEADLWENQQLSKKFTVKNDLHNNYMEMFIANIFLLGLCGISVPININPTLVYHFFEKNKNSICLFVFKFDILSGCYNSSFWRDTEKYKDDIFLGKTLTGVCLLCSGHLYSYFNVLTIVVSDLKKNTNHQLMLNFFQVS